MQPLILIVIGLIALCLGGLGVSRTMKRRRRRRRYCDAITAFAFRAMDDGGQLKALRADPVASAPAWYFGGVLALRADSMREAARAFGMAHHANHQLVSAALLTFAALKAKDPTTSDILEQIVQTWEEMGRPDIPASTDEHLILQELSDRPEAEISLSPLGKLTWCVVSVKQHARLLDPSQRLRWEALVNERVSRRP